MPVDSKMASRTRAGKPRKRAPKVYRSPTVEDRILNAIAEGVPLEVICRQPGTPAVSAFNGWVAADAELRERFRLAREQGHDAIATNARLTARGDPEHSSGDSKRDRLIIETDLKLLAVWNPRFAPKSFSAVEVRGDLDAGGRSVEELSEAEMADEMILILRAAAQRAGDPELAENLSLKGFANAETRVERALRPLKGQVAKMITHLPIEDGEFA